MKKAYVTANKLNVRRQPTVAPDNIMGVLDMGDKVEIVTNSDNSNWVLVSCRATWVSPGNTTRRGYVSKKFLRNEPTSSTAGRRYVTATTLNARSEPKVSSTNKIGTLRMATPVEFIEKSTVADWVLVECEADWLTRGPTRRRCFVSNKHLRNPARDSIEGLVNSAYVQWKRFKYGAGLEHRSPYFRYVGEMWSAIGLSLDGKDRSVPWSAAAISFMVRQSNQNYSGFKYSSGHWTFLNDAISDKQNRRPGPFWGYRISEKKPEVGDIIGRWRESRMTYNLAFAKSKKGNVNEQSYTSHSDIVIAVTNNAAYTLGGNVGHSVRLTRYSVDQNGFLTEGKNVFVLLKNKST